MFEKIARRTDCDRGSATTPWGCAPPAAQKAFQAGVVAFNGGDRGIDTEQLVWYTTVRITIIIQPIIRDGKFGVLRAAYRKRDFVKRPESPLKYSSAANVVSAQRRWGFSWSSTLCI